jgi:hypothetical protein
VGLTLLVALTCLVVFAQDALPLLFLPLLPIILAIFRIGRLGAAASVVLLTTIGGVLTVNGHGPIALIHQPVSTQVQFLQFYLACTVLTVLPVASELARRTGLYRRLHDSEARYRLLTENSTDIMLNLDVNGRSARSAASIPQTSSDRMLVPWFILTMCLRYSELTSRHWRTRRAPSSWNIERRRQPVSCAGSRRIRARLSTMQGTSRAW